jgi:3D (Asp-Asp-Asp) domain-containing protein
MNPFYYSRKFFTKKQVKRIVFTLILTFSWQLSGIDNLLGTTNIAQAAENSSPEAIVSPSEASVGTFSPTVIDEAPEEAKPTIQKIVKSSRVRSVSAYNAGDVNQCDGDPCTSANGENICQALEMGYKRCAANFVPFGTILRIEGYGDCMVVDRMNSRYPDGVDIAMKYADKQLAKNWGRRRVNVSIMILQEVAPENEIELAVK